MLNRKIRNALVLTSAALFAFTSAALAELNEETIHLCQTGNPVQVWQALNIRALSVSEKNDDGKTALMFMAETNTMPEAFISLINAGAKVNGRDKLGRTPLMYAAASNSSSTVIKTLLNAGANVNDRDIKGNTALMIAAQHSDNNEIISALLAAGADTGAVNSENKTALMLAAANKDLAGSEGFWELNNRHWEHVSSQNVN